MGEPSEGADTQEETNSESSVGSGVPCIDLTDLILETNNHIMTDGNKLQSVSLAADKLHFWNLACILQFVEDILREIQKYFQKYFQKGK